MTETGAQGNGELKATQTNKSDIYLCKSINNFQNSFFIGWKFWILQYKNQLRQHKVTQLCIILRLSELYHPRYDILLMTTHLSSILVLNTGCPPER